MAKKKTTKKKATKKKATKKKAKASKKKATKKKAKASKKKATKGKALAHGAKAFLDATFNSHPEWSLVAVEGPIEEVAQTLADYRGTTSWTKDATVTQAAKGDGGSARTVAIQLAGEPWTVIVRTLGFVDIEHLQGVVEDAHHVSKKLKTRAISFIGEDTSGAIGYSLFDRGKVQEEAEWTGSGADCMDFFKSLTRDDLPTTDYFGRADAVFR
jgi:hypothetical protein